MIEYPLFVPHGAARLAAILSVPEREPRGIVLFLTGIGLPQTIGSTLWARAAAALASDGIAAVRFDYAGIGDSTQLVERYMLGDTKDVTAQALAVLSAARSIVPCARFGLAGTCIGSRVTLELARDPECSGAVCIATPLLELGTWTIMDRRTVDWRAARLIRSHRRLKRALVHPLKKVFGRTRARGSLLRHLAASLTHTRVLFLYSESPRDHFSDQVRRLLLSSVKGLPATARERFALRIATAGPLTAFDALSRPTQDAIVDDVAGWLSASFPATGERFLDARSVANEAASESTGTPASA